MSDSQTSRADLEARKILLQQELETIDRFMKDAAETPTPPGDNLPVAATVKVYGSEVNFSVEPKTVDTLSCLTACGTCHQDSCYTDCS